MTQTEKIAISMGYTVDKKDGGRTFVKGDQHVWQCHGGWKRATFKAGEYTNWRIESYLADALLQEVDKD
tara:strand:- start:741 stop:947 length:207 start_codon:yes stop_codon:yes gene_type:complete